MRNLTRLLLGSVSVALLIACTSPNEPERDRDTVNVSGEGIVKAQPDTFSLVAVAQERGDDVAKLKNQVDRQVQSMLELAKELNIDDQKITASNIRIAPQWQYQPKRKLIGHQVSREVRFLTSGVERYAKLAGGLADLGLKNVRPGGSEISNATELANRALAKAVQAAREKAKILAQAADRELGDAIRIDSQTDNRHRPVPMRATMAEDNASESYRPGEQDVTASVQMTFQLN